MQFNWDILFWAGGAIILNIVFFLVARRISLNILHESERNEEEIKYEKKVWKYIKQANILAWIIILLIMVLYTGYVNTTPPPSIERSIEGIRPHTKEEIDEANKEALNKPMEEVEKEVQRSQKESEEQYKDFLNDAKNFKLKENAE